MTIPVYITKDAREKLWAYVLSMEGEVGGFGFATIDDEDRLVWYDAFLVDQDADASGVDFTDLGLAQAIERAAESNCFDDPNFTWVWWHSHGKLDVFWSSTDEGGIEALKKSGVRHMISVVANHQLKTKTRIDVFDVPIIGHAEFHDCELRRFMDEAFQYEVDADLEQFVRIRKPAATSTISGIDTGGGPYFGGVKDETHYDKDGIWKTKFPGPESKTGFSWNRERRLYFRPWTNDAERDAFFKQGKAPKQLPSGTRESDPGDKVEQALAEKAGYAEYSQEELSGMSPEEQAWRGEIRDSYDDAGQGFDWSDVIDYIPDEDEASEWRKLGHRVIKYQGEYFLMETGSMDPANQLDEKPEIVEVHAS